MAKKKRIVTDSEKAAWKCLDEAKQMVEVNQYSRVPKKERKVSQFAYPLIVPLTTDITHKSFLGKIPRAVGRTVEIERITDILSKMKKNNIVLVGESGVGKTAIVEELANKIVSGEVPAAFKNCRILQFDSVSSIANSKYRGEFEGRIKGCFERINESDDDVILYIDNISSTISLGDAEAHTLSLASILKSTIVNSKIRIIGTSTFADFKKFEADKSLNGNFESIQIMPPTVDECMQILKFVKKDFCKFYNVKIDDAALTASIDLTEQYIPEDNLPAKAVDVLDEACAIRCNSKFLNKKVPILISNDDVLYCISRKKNIPLDSMRTSQNLNNLENILNSKVIGQKHVCKAISKSIRRAQVGLNDENRPIASFLFIGPTGVGKTEVTKCLADAIFSGRNNIIRFDMSEYMEEISVSKLIGSPPGYVGYKESGLLTEMVRRHPYSLVLFDEFEKAHFKICNLLLQILDEGCLTNSNGEKINFKNTVIVLTSNVGVSELNKKAVGFGEQSDTKSKDIMAEVKRKFPPEFLNRLDEIIQFNKLTQEDILKITALCINTDIVPKLKKQNVNVSIDESVLKIISNHGYNPEYGARELKRVISNEIKNPLADYLISNPEAADIKIFVKSNKIQIASAVSE